MKRGLFALLALSSICAVACKTAPVRTNISVADNEKRVAIAISDDGNGGYVIEASLPNRAYLKIGKKIRWSIINNCKTATVTSLVIDDFHTLDNVHRTPFGNGSPEDQKFEYKELDLRPGKEDSKKSSKEARDVSPDQERAFKYRVSVTMSVGTNPQPVDPMVVIGN
jgi:hypothetical protein